MKPRASAERSTVRAVAGRRRRHGLDSRSSQGPIQGSAPLVGSDI